MCGFEKTVQDHINICHYGPIGYKWPIRADFDEVLTT